MCGIIGYTGLKPAQPFLLNGLAKLEYRGYDSCGIALSDPDLKVFKDAVRVAELGRSLPSLSGATGIGHTRWATHGPPSQSNAHPHTDCTGRIAVVHNGIINNYSSLKKQLIAEGHHFNSETDTEVISHLVEKYYHDDLTTAVEAALTLIQGSYAIIVMAAGKSELVVARRDSPLVLGIGDGENFIASDIPAVLDYTSRVIYLEDGDIGVITPTSITFRQDGHNVVREEQKVLWTAEQARKGGYEHFLIKEIHEQPRIVRETLAEYLNSTEPIFEWSGRHPRSLLYVACGTSYHAALIGKYAAEQLLDIPVQVEVASEFNYLVRCPAASVGVGITQSGETADTLKAMRRLKASGSQVLAVTNIVGSTASKIADDVIYMHAGPEISVAATKTFTSQLLALYWLALSCGERDQVGEVRSGFRQIPRNLQQVLNKQEIIASAAEILADYENAFFVGRGISYPVALEGALKLKEVSYIHAEACGAGEMKHGTFALLGKDLPVVAIIAWDRTREAMLTNIKEIKTRGSPVLAIAPEDDEEITELADIVLPVPAVEDIFSPFVNAVVVQLLAYYAAKKRGCPIDFPRNLAKSVTVE